MYGNKKKAHDTAYWSDAIAAHGEMLARVVVHLDRVADLLEVVLALRAAGRFAGRLDRRQQQCNQKADDRDHDQNFDEREAETEKASAHGRVLSAKGTVVRQVGQMRRTKVGSCSPKLSACGVAGQSQCR